MDHKLLETAESARSKGNAAFKAKDFANAEKLYTVSLGFLSKVDRDPARIPTVLCLSNRAMARIKLRNYSGAVEDATSALELDPENAKAFYRRGLAYQAMGRADRAIASFYGVLRYDPDNASAKQKLDDLGVHPPHTGYPRVQPDTPTPRPGDESSPPAADVGVAPPPPDVAALSSDAPSGVANGPPLLHPAVAHAHGVAATAGSEGTAAADEGALAGAAGPPSPLMPDAPLASAPASDARLPQPSTQRHIVRRLFSQSAGQSLVPDDVCFVVEWGWWRRWCDHVAFEEEEEEGEEHGESDAGAVGGGDGAKSGPQPPPPGPIDNAPLVKPGSPPPANSGSSSSGAASGGSGVGGRVAWVAMRGGLVENSQFALVPLEVWRALVDWYGGGPALARPVVVDKLTGKPKVQLYTEAELKEQEAEWERERDELRLKRLQEMKKRAEAAGGKGGGGGGGGLDGSGAGTSLLVPGLVAATSLCVVCGATYDCKRCRRCMRVAYCSQLCQRAHWPYHKSACAAAAKAGADADAVPALRLRGRRGAVGLRNLGNTCFMNSALQCLSHTDILTTHLVSHRFLDEINEDNPLGTGGALTKAFSSLLKDLWLGMEPWVTPMVFLRAICRFAPQFAGGSQHDSQEFLTYLIDGVHEDLNQVKKKPYVEMPEGGSRPDAEVAAEAWSKHLARNRSAVVDHVHGQFKSTVVCPDCRRVSVTFDPFSSVSLEMPRHTRTFHVLFVPQPRLEDVERGAPSPLPVHHALHLAPRATVADALRELSGAARCPTAEMVALVAEGGRMKRSARARDELSELLGGSDGRPDCPGPVLAVYESRGDAPVVLVSQALAEAKLAEAVEAAKAAKAAAAAAAAAGEQADADADAAMGRRHGAMVAPLPLVVTYSRGFTMIQLRRLIWHQLRRLGGPMPEEAARLAEEELAREVEEAKAAEGGVDPDPSKVELWRAVVESAVEAEIMPLSAVRFLDQTGRRQETVSLDDGDLLEQGVASVLGRNTAYLVVDWTGDYGARVDVVAGAACEVDASVGAPDPSADASAPECSRPIQRGAVSLEACFRKFSTAERLDENNKWYCNRCGEHKQARKHMEFWRLPDVLVVHLKRFKYSDAGPRGYTILWRSKLNTLVDFPLEGLDLSPYLLTRDQPGAPPPIYDLYAVSNHFGNMGFGHYTAFARAWAPQSPWREFDDSHVTTVPDPSAVVSPAAYILFYKRRSIKASPERPLALASGADEGTKDAGGEHKSAL